MSNGSTFWRDPALAFIEARGVADGRKVCYARHSHEGFSIGAITAGRSTYFDGQRWHEVEAGSVVMMNPGVVHACNPIADQPWSYLMLYVDMPWLRGQGFEPLAQTLSTSPTLYRGLVALYERLTDSHCASEDKRLAAECFFGQLREQIEAAPLATGQGNERLQRAADYIRAHCTEPLKLEDIGEAAGLSTSYLIRAFKQHFGLTPHGFLLDHRVRYARAQLRQGRLIAEVAHEAGFADQAHLQRAFKQHLAATPGHYRSAQ
ncbi:AraC family transcriptional regulator [Pseudomonas sp. 148P]|uniref:AraC family transcriptional regulator n=1 Tax=Pseudomonas ulcerans TaxID=3115852 RepID=A0ABU7HTC8_9PSED|nr:MULTISPECIES: AraC family transcriptional regulator [unclassified Pseudomonas]MEE1925898.1 AraC family transcriptional regulator [Pseudomonas sp. 147P]MEE1934769.1 AraC family transcriptional regulator [Pseudomonas sp. 148P]